MPTKAKRGETVDLFITLTDSASDTSKSGGKETTKVKFAWKGTKEAYPDEIAKELGVTIAKDNEPGLIFGMNRPRPARVYINVKTGSGGAKAGGKSKSNHRAYFLFANPAKLGTLLIKNSLKGKKYRGGTISSVSLPKTSTNPNRPKKSKTAAKPKTRTR